MEVLADDPKTTESKTLNASKSQLVYSIRFAGIAAISQNLSAHR